MLILSRKSGEKIVIGENVTIRVNRVKGNRVTLAIEAPKDIRIIRSELNSLEKKDLKENPKSEPSEEGNAPNPLNQEKEGAFILGHRGCLNPLPNPSSAP
ncbi:MAG: carbon storage regulator [Pirellulaceae bacterium]|nr:carbon storage regulator [Pirellulaceae bacterium]